MENSEKHENLSGADLRDANLSGADLRYANIRRADLAGADLHDANLYHADLCHANLSGVNLRRADLSGADLREADLPESDMWLNIGGYMIYIHSLVDGSGQQIQIGCQLMLRREWEALSRESLAIFADDALCWRSAYGDTLSRICDAIKQ